MRKTIITVVLVAQMLTPVQAAIVQNIDATTARKMLQENEDVFLLDVRTSQEYLQVRLAGAHLIPIDEVLARSAEIPEDQPLLVYCAVGARSSKVSEYLARQGYSAVYNLNGGIWAWQLRKFPVLKGPP